MESQKIFQEADESNANTPVILNMLLRIVTSIDGRLKSIEASVDTIKDIKKEIMLMSAKVRGMETKFSETMKLQKALDSCCEALGGMFDDVKAKCGTYHEALTSHSAQLSKHAENLKKQSDKVDLT